MRRDLFHDEQGFSTIGMAVALLVALALVFSGAQVYRVSSAAAEVQEVADAAALAAENEVAEFMVVANLCDGVILTMSLTGLTAYGLGIAALCTPVTAKASETLIDLGNKILEKRSLFAEKATQGLNELQKALPFMAAANAASVASANNQTGAAPGSYLALAMLVSSKGQDLVKEESEEDEVLEEEVDENAEELREDAAEVEEAAEIANEAKLRAYEADCGGNPSYCLYERANKLAGLNSTQNPFFNSVDAWDFSVPLERARTYYARRAVTDSPTDGSIREAGRSALRRTFYRYAYNQMLQGYVREAEDSFEAYFPTLPRNTMQMRQTSLYTQVVYPITQDSEGRSTMHAWAGCPRSSGYVALGSIAQLDLGDWETCPSCEFQVSSMGNIAAASTAIQNGFEYHYAVIAQVAKDYEAARKKQDEASEEVKSKAEELFELLQQALEAVKSKRIHAQPPGSYGVIAVVVNTQETPASLGFDSSFVMSGQTLGARVAVSAATLLEDESDEGRTVINSLLDSFAQDGGVAVGIAGVVLDCWSSLLKGYGDGQVTLEKAVGDAIDSIPFASESGLGTWASKKLKSLFEGLGLEPANLNALRPVLVNSSQVAGAGESEFAVNYLSVQSNIRSMPASSSDLFTSAIAGVEQQVLEKIEEGTFELAVISLPFGVEVPITLVLPSSVKASMSSVVANAAQQLRGLYASITGRRIWE